MNKEQTNKKISPRLIIESISLSITFFIFTFILLSIKDPQPIFGATIPVIYYRSLSVIPFFMFIIFTASLLIPRIIIKYEELFDHPPAWIFWRICWALFLGMLWLAIFTNFVEAMFPAISRIPQILRPTAIIITSFWPIFVLIAIIINLYENKRRILKSIWNIPTPTKIRQFIYRINGCLITLLNPPERTEREGSLVRFFDCLFSFLRIISFLEWYRYFHKQKASYPSAEIYIIVWFFAGLIFLLAILPQYVFPTGSIGFIFFLSLFGIRLIDMFQASINGAIFKRRLIDPKRFLILNLTVYAELIIIFAVIVALNQGSFTTSLDAPWKGYDLIVQSLHYSFSGATFQGTSVIYTNLVGKSIFLVEGVFAFTYIFIILGSAINLLPPLKEKNKNKA